MLSLFVQKQGGYICPSAMSLFRPHRCTALPPPLYPSLPLSLPSSRLAFNNSDPQSKIAHRQFYELRGGFRAVFKGNLVASKIGEVGNSDSTLNNSHARHQSPAEGGASAADGPIAMHFLDHCRHTDLTAGCVKPYVRTISKFIPSVHAFPYVFSPLP